MSRVHDLAALTRVWHPRYRRLLGILLLVSTGASAVVYAENSALTELAARLGAGAGLAAIGIAIGVFAALRILRSGLSYLQTRVTGSINNATRCDLESACLDELLHQQESFFTRHPPGSIINRLGMDVTRTGEMRTIVGQVLWAAMLVLGALVFFFRQDPYLGLVAALSCAVSTLLTQRLMEPVRLADGVYRSNDDLAKARFAEYLGAVSEVQIGALFPAVHHDFRAVHGRRSQAFRILNHLQGVHAVTSSLAGLGSMLAMIGLAIWLQQHSAGRISAALLPVIIMALPGLFQHSSAIVINLMRYKIGRSSAQRLLEFASAPEEREEPVAGELAGGGLVGLDAATYRYESEGVPSGGLREASVAFRRSELVAICGGSGSGKSTLVRLLLGLLDPQSGAVLVAERRLERMPSALRSRLFSFMPQGPALLDASIAANLRFGLEDADGDFDDAQRDLLERLEIADLCRAKALDLPVHPAAEASAVVACRARARARLREAGVAYVPLEETLGAARWSVAERLLAGVIDSAELCAALASRRGRAALERMAHGAAGRELIAAARELVESDPLLARAPSAQAYNQVADRPLAPPVHELRRRALDAPARDRVRTLLAVALSAREPPLPPAAEALADELRSLLGERWHALDAEAVQPRLSWRDNLCFAELTAANDRQARAADSVLLEVAREAGLDRRLVDSGLDYGVGPGGGRLSGGQGQLVALGRTLLRRRPFTVLDEPTSALDPERRARLGAAFRELIGDRCLIAITHDGELMAAADRVVFLHEGAVAAVGTHESLLRESAAYARFHGGEDGPCQVTRPPNATSCLPGTP